MKPGLGRPLGGELAADDCLLEYHGVIDMCPSIRILEGEVAPDINFGVAVVDIPLGEAEVDIIFGVASGVRRWLMCGERAYFWTGVLAAVYQIDRPKCRGLNHGRLENIEVVDQ